MRSHELAGTGSLGTGMYASAVVMHHTAARRRAWRQSQGATCPPPVKPSTVSVWAVGWRGTERTSRSEVDKLVRALDRLGGAASWTARRALPCILATRLSLMGATRSPVLEVEVLAPNLLALAAAA